MVTRLTKIKGPVLKKRRKKTHITRWQTFLCAREAQPIMSRTPHGTGTISVLGASVVMRYATAQVLSHDVFTDNAVRVFARAHQQLGNVLLGQINLLHFCHCAY